MTKAAALQAFFEQLGIDVYTSTSAPEDAAFPYLTYELATGNWYTGSIGITVNLWYYSTSEVAINAKAQELLEMVSPHTLVECDNGAILIMPGTPWCQSVADTDPNIKRRYINITLEYLTTK